MDQQAVTHLLIKTLFDGLADQVGLVVHSDLDGIKYVLFRDGQQLRVLELEDQSLAEFTTISYGALN